MKKNKKKVFFIMSTNEFSGAESVNLSIFENLKEKYDFYWVSKIGEINEFLTEKGIEFIPIIDMKISEINRVIKEYNPDIIHATDYRASFFCSIVKHKTKLISHVHNNAFWLKKRKLNSLAFLFTGIRSNKILTVSKSIEREYVFSRYIKKKIFCVGNPVSTTKIRNMVNIEDNEKIYDICCVGRVTEQKDPIRFLNIIYKLKQKKSNLKVCWIGKGELEDEFKSKIKQLNLENNIEYKGFQKNPYVFMKKAKVFLLVSKWEGFGLVVFEALSLGVPTVVSKVGGLPDIVDNECGNICNNDQEFIEEVNKLLVNKEYYDLKKKNALIKAESLDNIDKYCENISEIYKEVLESKK